MVVFFASKILGKTFMIHSSPDKSRIVKIVLNEIKKFVFVISISSFSFLMSFIPFLVPVSIGLTSILLSISFIDYSWSRDGLSFRHCVKDVKRSFFGYMISGFIFMFLLSVPIVNLLVLPLAVIYFTIFYIERNKPELIESI